MIETPIADLAFPKSLTPPPRLYHYTSQNGLLGILSSKSLWATRLQYLNDSAELAHTIALWKDAVQYRLDQLEDIAGLAQDTRLEVETIFQGLQKSFDFVSKIKIHVACFSEDGDSLSQWRGYCRGGAGFSIGFESSQLITAASKQRCFLAPCIYDPAKQASLIEAMWTRILGRPPAEKRKTSRGLEFVSDFVTLATVLKHPSFAEEREWRIITQEISDDHPSIGIRQGRVVLTPYFDFQLVEAPEKLNLELVVGPTPEIDLSLASVSALLTRKSCIASTRASKVPYREL
ncbi:MAG TPA: DUF2971 domain-containing protein [Candidatus Dormibacteraeota bacterium]|nr:DUF2971 domain-containing protein [Candidatus Dormibacteraeota bacterium]